MRRKNKNIRAYYLPARSLGRRFLSLLVVGKGTSNFSVLLDPYLFIKKYVKDQHMSQDSNALNTKH